MGLSRTKSERTYPEVSKHSWIRDCFGSGMATVPSTQTEMLGSRNEETCSGTVQDARRLYSLLTLSWVIMLKIDWFSFFNQITRVFGCASLFNRSPNWNLFHLIFCSILHTHFCEL
jgi:hypothetical protein